MRKVQRVVLEEARKRYDDQAFIAWLEGARAMNKPRLLDLFCGAGGAAMGYSRAGFEVVGVDIKPQPHYPFEFVQMDALELLAMWVQGLHYRAFDFDAIHASPPCQGYSAHVSSSSSRWVPTLGRDEPRLIAAVRETVACFGVPYVIENVVGARAELRSPVMLCGAMFGLDLPRHRLFETSATFLEPPHGACRGIAKAASSRRGWEYRDMTVTGKGRHAGTADRWRELLGIDWPTTQHELSEAIPPSYTEFIGKQLLASLHWVEEEGRGAVSAGGADTGMEAAE